MSAFLPLALAFSGALTAPAGSPAAPAPELDAAVLLVTEHGFRAVNPTCEDRVLVLGDRSSGAVALAPLPAGADAFWPLSPGDTRDLVVDVVTLGEGGPVRSGAMSIDLGLLTAGAPLLLLAGDDVAGSFLVTASGDLVELDSTLGTGEPVATAAVTAAPSPMVSLVHVPVVVPTEEKGGDKPPHLDEAPLPVF